MHRYDTFEEAYSAFVHHIRKLKVPWSCELWSYHSAKRDGYTQYGIGADEMLVTNIDRVPAIVQSYMESLVSGGRAAFVTKRAIFVHVAVTVPGAVDPDIDGYKVVTRIVPVPCTDARIKRELSTIGAAR